MRIILLLLIALAGPFCTFIQASTLVVPTLNGGTPEPETVKEMPAVIATTKESALQEAASAPVPVPDATEAAASTEAPSVSTRPQDIQSDVPKETPAPTNAAPATEATPATEAAPATEVAPAEMATTDAPTEVTEPRAEPGEPEETKSPDVQIEGEEGMGTGQLVGIVIGALIGVIVVIAVIILVVRRMGQYSTAKKRKPQKQDSILISPLKRKARQEEKKKKLRKF